MTVKVTKKEKKEAQPKQKIEQSTEYLKCIFTEEEVREMSNDLARKISDLDNAQARKKETVKSIDSDIASIEAKIKELARKVNDKYEFRGVKCKTVIDYEKKKKTITRLDTGEIHLEKDLTEEECQLSF